LCPNNIRCSCFVPALFLFRRASLNSTRRAAPQLSFAPDLTDRQSNGYYNGSAMSDSGLQAYAPLLIHFLVATALAGALTTLSVLVGWRRPSRVKQLPYECGMEPTGDARAPISVKFYLVAMVFILFDVEAIFLYPWAYIYRDLLKMSPSIGLYGFAEMMIYIAILLVGYFYLWKKGALDWHKY
jgi:NADH-quinone oxidoreductase subunit A